LLLFLSDSHNTGYPIHRALCDGWDVNRPPATEPFALAVASEIELGFSPASSPAAQRLTALPKAGAKPEGREATDDCLCFCLFFISAFSTQKTHVKPKTTQTKWNQPAIHKTAEKNKQAPQGHNLCGANSFRKKILNTTHLL
jgi:hypothetical protein